MKAEVAYPLGTKRRVVKDQKTNFETLKQAVEDGRVCLMDCVLKSTMQHVAVLCAMNCDERPGEVGLVPFAMLFNGNPYKMLLSPDQWEGLERKAK